LAEIDPNLVTFDGPDDPLNPKNWPVGKKWGTTIMMTVYAFLAPFASSILVSSSFSKIMGRHLLSLKSVKNSM
jgi:hypothetical protein